MFVNGQLLAMTRMYQDIAKMAGRRVSIEYFEMSTIKNKDLSGKYVPVFGWHGCQKAKGQTERVVTVVTVKQPCLEKDTL